MSLVGYVGLAASAQESALPVHQAVMFRHEDCCSKGLQQVRAARQARALHVASSVDITKEDSHVSLHEQTVLSECFCSPT